MPRPEPYDIKLGVLSLRVDRRTYTEQGPAATFLDRQMYQSATGELDFGKTWPYPQRSWILGEQQFYTHEFDEMKTTATRRYQEGHGIDVSKEGEVGLLKEIERTLATTSNPTTCPLIASVDGASVYAFPAGETKMYKYNAGSWDSGETITGVTAPVTDAYMAGNGMIYVIDSNASGSRVLQRTTGGTWSRVTPNTSTLTDGNTEVYVTPTELDDDTKYLTRIPVTYNCSFTKLYLHMDGDGSGTGNQAVKAVVYSDVAGSPDTLLGTSGEVSITDGQAEGDVEFTFSSIDLTAGYVWVGPHASTNELTARWYGTLSVNQDYVYNTDAYSGGAESSFSGGTFDAQKYSAYIDATYVIGQWGSDAFDDANAVVWINGELYIITDDEAYCHSLNVECSEFCGGIIACTHDGALYWTDGSNKVYEYNGIGAREVIGQLPPGFTVQSLFSAHARMWICGRLSSGDAAVYWYGQGQYGILASFPAASGSTRDIYAGAASDEYVIFADSRYGGTIRHYVPEGGWNHYLEYGTATTIPYKGVVTGAGKTFIALATGVAGTQGVYCEATTYVTSGTLTSSQMDLQMPAHKKRWTEQVLSTLPLRKGERIMLEASANGGRTFEAVGYMDDLDQVTGDFALDYESQTLQYRLTLYAGTDQATDPKLLSAVTRGMPIRQQGRMWSFTIPGNPTGALSGRAINKDTKLTELCAKANDSEVLDFEDLWGKEYRVTMEYKRRPAYDGGTPTNTGSIVEVALQEQL